MRYFEEQQQKVGRKNISSLLKLNYRNHSISFMLFIKGVDVNYEKKMRNMSSYFACLQS